VSSSDNCAACDKLKVYLKKMEWEGYDMSYFTVTEDPMARVAFKVLGVPTTVILDEDDEEVDRKVGAPNWGEWFYFLEKHGLMKKKRGG